jgi:hypothetical protein
MDTPPEVMSTCAPASAFSSAAANPLEDRSLEVMAALDISVERQIRRVRRALGGQPLNL